MKTVRVAIQGEAGSFSDEAARALFGEDTVPVPCREFRDLLEPVRDGRADYALLPIENSIAGSVLPAYDLLATTELHVLAEITRPIRHCLLALPDTQLSDLRRVLSHPVALAQCTRFFESHPLLEAIAVYDTAGAAKDVAQRRDRTLAAIAAFGAAQRYGLKVLATDLQDRDDNQTRFYVMAAEAASLARGGERWKSALLLETANSPGALVAVLTPFARHAVNLTKLESRPAETPWTYRFFLEFDGAVSDPGVAAGLEEAAHAARRVRVIGSFPVVG